MVEVCDITEVFGYLERMKAAMIHPHTCCFTKKSKQKKNCTCQEISWVFKATKKQSMLSGILYERDIAINQEEHTNACHFTPRTSPTIFIKSFLATTHIPKQCYTCLFTRLDQKKKL